MKGDDLISFMNGITDGHSCSPNHMYMMTWWLRDIVAESLVKYWRLVSAEKTR